MRIKLVCDSRTAEQSHRQQEEYLEVGVNDKIS